MIKSQRQIEKIPFSLLLGACLVLLSELGWFSRAAFWLPADPGLMRELAPHIREVDWPSPEQDASGQRIIWLGHSGYLIEWAGKRLLLDPNFSSRCKIAPRLWPQERSWLPAVDAVLISHAHYDHLDLPSLAGLVGQPKLLVPKGIRPVLGALALEKGGCIELEPSESFALGPLLISAWRAEHGGSRYHPFHWGPPALCYLIEGPGETIFFAGDSGYGPHFRQIGQQFHPGIAILPIGAYEPRFLLKAHHLNPSDALQAAKDLGARRIIPSHFGTYRLAFDLPLQGLEEWIKCAPAALEWDIPVRKGLWK